MPAGCLESRRGSDRAPAYRAVQSAQNLGVLARLPPAAPRPSAHPTPPGRCSVSGPQRPCQPIPPPNGAQRSQGLAQRRDRATARRRPNTQEVAPRRSRTAGSTPPARPKTGLVPARNSCRRQCARHHTVAAANAAGCPAWARTADAMRRTPIPSRTGNQWCALCGSPMRSRPDNRATRSCRHPLHQTPPTPDSHRHELPRRTGRACRARPHGRSAPSRRPAP